MTGDHHMLEYKGVDQIRIRNHMRLFVTGNPDWMVPAGFRSGGGRCSTWATSTCRTTHTSPLAELEGLSANAAAKELDRRGFVSARGGKWSARSIIKRSRPAEGLIAMAHPRDTKGRSSGAPCPHRCRRMSSSP